MPILPKPCRRRTPFSCVCRTSFRFRFTWNCLWFDQIRENFYDGKNDFEDFYLQNCTSLKTKPKDHFGSSCLETLDVSHSSWESCTPLETEDVEQNAISVVSLPDLSMIAHAAFVCWRSGLNYMHLSDYEPHILLGLLAFGIAVWAYWYFTEIKPERSSQSGIDIAPTSHMTIFMQMKSENLMMKHMLEEASVTIGSLQGQVKMLEDENMELLCSCPKPSRPSPKLISTGKYPEKYAPRTSKSSRRSWTHTFVLLLFQDTPPVST